MRWPPPFLLSLVALAGVAGSGHATGAELRVCADPNNLPFSDRAGEGFENKLAELVGRELQLPVVYTWHAQRRGFVRETLRAGKCDVIMGVPTTVEMVETTRPYYRSQYVFVTRADRHLDLSSLKDPRLRELLIGVHLIGDDGANTPPADALGRVGITDNVRGYMIYGDYREVAPPARLVRAVENREVDIAAVWGPLAGYFARSSPVPLRLTPITGTEDFAPLVFAFDVSMGVRHGDHELKAKLDHIIERNTDKIRALLVSYGVPQLPVSGAKPADQDD
jgi:mxaJ protein